MGWHFIEHWPVLAILPSEGGFQGESFEGKGVTNYRYHRRKKNPENLDHSHCLNHASSQNGEHRPKLPIF